MKSKQVVWATLNLEISLCQFTHFYSIKVKFYSPESSMVSDNAIGNIKYLQLELKHHKKHNIWNIKQ